MTTTRASILRIAVRLFFENGYAATPLSAIAGEANLTKAALYHHFATKEQILFELVQEFHLPERGTVVASAPPPLPDDPVERLRLQFEQQALRILEHYELSGVVFRELGNLSAEHRALMVTERDAIERRTRDDIQAGQRTGQLRADLDPKLTSLFILSGITTVFTWYKPGGAHTPASIAAQIADLYMRGIEVPGGED